MPPEAITGRIWGYVVGGLIIGASALIQYAAARLFARWRVTSVLALVLPALIFVAIMMVTLRVGQTVVGGVQMVLLAFVIWRHGYVAGVIAFWLPDVLTDGLAFLTSGGSGFVTAGVITLTLALVPLVVAAVAYRRQTRTMPAVVLSRR